jgi:hypothetical protein
MAHFHISYVSGNGTPYTALINDAETLEQALEHLRARCSVAEVTANVMVSPTLHKYVVFNDSGECLGTTLAPTEKVALGVFWDQRRYDAAIATRESALRIWNALTPEQQRELCQYPRECAS